MKKVIFYVLCLQLVLVAGCNNAGETKTAAADSTKAMEKTDSISKKNVICLGKWPAAINYDLTKDNLWDSYTKFKKTTEKVKFNYDAFMTFAARGNGEIYLVYGAYDKDGTTRYLETHNPSVPIPIKDSDIINKPCLLEAYQSANGLVYNDFFTGSLCPPPGSCSSDFTASIKRNPKITKTDVEIRDDILKHYNDQYDNDRVLNLTEKVKFCVSDIRSAVAALDTKTGNKTVAIYFALGAYTDADAGQYVNTHQLPTSEQTTITSKPCLLFAYYDKINDRYIYLDFGVLCPPGK